MLHSVHHRLVPYTSKLSDPHDLLIELQNLGFKNIRKNLNQHFTYSERIWSYMFGGDLLLTNNGNANSGFGSMRLLPSMQQWPIVLASEMHCER